MSTVKEKKIALRPPAISPEVIYMGKTPTYHGYKKPKNPLKSAKDMFLQQRENAVTEYAAERSLC